VVDPGVSVRVRIEEAKLSGTDLASCRLLSASAESTEPLTSADRYRSLAYSQAIEANVGYRSLYVGLCNAATPSRSSAVGAYRSISFIC
jgi:hypothetical protein